MELTSKNRRSIAQNRQDQGRIRRQKKQTPKRSGAVFGNAFLNHRFKPILGLPESLTNVQHVQREFRESLLHICSLYSLQVEIDPDAPFPANMLKAFREVKALLSEKEPSLSVHLIQDEKRLACLATAKPYYFGAVLYLIPIKYVSDLMQNKKQQSGNLLLSLFACLHQQGVSLYRNGFVGSQYDWLRESAEGNIEQGESEEDYEPMLADLKIADKRGKWFEKEMRMPKHAQQFAYRLKHFKANSKQDESILQLSTLFSEIRTDFPQRTILGSIHEGLFPEDDSYYNNDRTRPDQYLSFCWEDCDSFTHEFWDNVNAELQEHTDIISPTAVQVFDIPHAKAEHDFSFENRMFDFLEKLCQFLYELP